MAVPQSADIRTWTADNGDGTFSNPLFYDEFSDPDLIRVGNEFYLTGTSMHTMPGLPVLRSNDLINWEFVRYACPRLDLGPGFRLEDGVGVYGQGFWAPCFRFHDGEFHIFSNVNGQKTQHFRTHDPAGTWRHSEMKRGFHDLSVLFDDDGAAYIVWGYQELHIARLDDNLDDIVESTDRVAIPSGTGMGEGCHFYKVSGKYYIASAWFAGRMRMACARADNPFGPYEVNPEISGDEEFGIGRGNRLSRSQANPFEIAADHSNAVGRQSMHQGGIVETTTGDWWGFSMMDCNSVGRLTCLSPITWHEGWPYFGLPGNLGRTPRTWRAPCEPTGPPQAPFERSGAFDGSALAPIWQWNHAPDDSKWSLAERPGCLRLHSLPAPDFWPARNTITQRAIGPRSTPTVVLDTNCMRAGDVAGLALLNYPYAWIGVRRTEAGTNIAAYDQRTGQSAAAPFAGGRVWLRAECDFLTESASLSYSVDGAHYAPLAERIVLVFQLRTFQGVRYALFHYNDLGTPGGWADFERFDVYEPCPSSQSRPIPFGETIAIADRLHGLWLTTEGGGLAARRTLDPAATFRVLCRPLGRVGLQCAIDGRVVAVDGFGEHSRLKLAADDAADESQQFQWMESLPGDLLLMSVTGHRYMTLTSDGAAGVCAPGATPGGGNGASLAWSPVRDPSPLDLMRPGMTSEVDSRQSGTIVRYDGGAAAVTLSH